MTSEAEQRALDLNPAFKAYCESLYAAWIKENPPPKPLAFNPNWMFDRCEALAEKWDRYIKPLAEAWWAERGYRLTWPKRHTEPCSVEVLDGPSPR